jgi:hypothetical protein
MPLSRYGGRFGFGPDDMALMQRVFDAVCKERGLTKEDVELREALAANIVLLFNRGLVNEAELLRALSKRCGASRSGRQP